jgi:hypothetical protein
MLPILVAIRDFLLATALAWVGVSIERPHHNANEDAQCAGQSCQAQEQR